MSRVYNFSAGPAVLPKPVLKEDTGQLQGIIPSGRCFSAVCHDSNEPDEKQSC